MNSYVVEFWPMPAADVRAEDQPKEVPCADQAEAIELEAKFHAVGWAARAVRLTVERNYPTAGRPRVARAA